MRPTDSLARNLITVQQVTFCYGRAPSGAPPLLAGVNLQIQRGQIINLLGRSGSGKSTMLKLLAGIFRPLAGHIEWHDQCHPAHSPPRLAMMFQNNALFDSMTVIENISYSRQKAVAEPAAKTTEVSYELLQQVGLTGLGHKFPRELSGGMQKRAALARALAIEPLVLLCDDPVAGLDPVTGRSIISVLNAAQHRYRMSMVCSFNDLARARQLSSDCLVIMDNQLKPMNFADPFWPANFSTTNREANAE